MDFGVATIINYMQQQQRIGADIEIELVCFIHTGMFLFHIPV